MKYYGWVSIEGCKKNHFVDNTLPEYEARTLCGFYLKDKTASEPNLPIHSTQDQYCKICNSALDMDIDTRDWVKR